MKHNICNDNDYLQMQLVIMKKILFRLHKTDYDHHHSKLEMSLADILTEDCLHMTGSKFHNTYMYCSQYRGNLSSCSALRKWTVTKIIMHMNGVLTVAVALYRYGLIMYIVKHQTCCYLYMQLQIYSSARYSIAFLIQHTCAEDIKLTNKTGMSFQKGASLPRPQLDYPFLTNSKKKGLFSLLL